MHGSPSTIKLNVSGMTCSHCVAGVTKRLTALGLTDVVVNLSTETVQFSGGDLATLPNIIASIEQLGYTVQQSGQPRRRTTLSLIEVKLLISLIGTVPLLLHMIFPWQLLHRPLVQFFLSLPPVLVGVQHFGKSAWLSLKNRMPNMDVLIFMGFSAAFIYSAIGTFLHLGPDYLFYETAAVIISAVLFGNVLENRSLRRTTSAIEELHHLQVKLARMVQTKNGTQEIREVPVEELEVGDHIIVARGENVPADGEIIDGQASVDEAIISGESIPVERTAGNPVVSGTVVLDGNFTMRVSAVGEGTVLANIIRLVENAQAAKPSIQKLGDQVSAVFVPVVIVIALLTFVSAFLFFDVSLQASLMRAVAVLVIACPCAMGLATPTAVVVGLGRAAKRGVLIKGGNTIEQLATIKTMAFDKTGTLTTGKFSIRKITVLQYDLNYIQSVILGMTQRSTHPISKSLSAALTEASPLSFTSVKELAGKGLSATDHRGVIFNLYSSHAARDFVQDKDHDLYLLEHDQPIALIDIEDSPKISAATTVAALAQAQIITALISGDHTRACEALTTKLGIDIYFAEQTPQQKLECIEELQRHGPVAFVGDGINDAPALAKATVGIALSDGTQVAINSAQVVLLNGELSHLIDAVAISRATLRTIKQNLFWAFCYNIVAIPLAACGYMGPALGAFAMMFSDVIVIGNSLRLKVRRITL